MPDLWQDRIDPKNLGYHRKFQNSVDVGVLLIVIFLITVYLFAPTLLRGPEDIAVFVIVAGLSSLSYRLTIYNYEQDEVEENAEKLSDEVSQAKVIPQEDIRRRSLPFDRGVSFLSISVIASLLYIGYLAVINWG